MRNILIISAFLTLFTSCAKEVILDPGERPYVVVECVLSDEPVQTLRLSYTKAPSAKESPVLSDAEAVLLDVTAGVEAGGFVKGGDGTWRLDYAAVPGHRYRLEVRVPGYESVWAEDAMPELNMSSFKYSQFLYNGTSKNEELLRSDGYVCDTNGPFGSYGNSTILCGGVYYSTSDMPEHLLLYAMVLDETTGEYSMADEICTDFEGAQPLNLSGGVYECHHEEFVKGDLLSSASYLSEDHYNILEIYPTLQGAGFFDRFILMEKPESPQKHFFVASVPCDIYVNKPAYMVFTSLSDSYYEYLKEYFSMEKSDGLSAIYLRENSYSNIHGGCGLFGCRVSKDYEWSAELTETMRPAD